MRAVLLVALVALAALTGCDSDERRAWAAQRARLELEVAEREALKEELTTPDPSAGFKRVIDLAKELDVAGLLRSRGSQARVFITPGAVRVARTGTAQECLDAIDSAAPVRWLLPRFWLRLEGDRCVWEARSDATYAALEQLVASGRPRFTPPPTSVLRWGVKDEQRAVAELEARLGALDAELGPRAALLRLVKEGDQRGPLADRARPAPCDRAIVARHLALDDEAAAKVLELEEHKLVQPLEPEHDARLRGLVARGGPGLQWRCDERPDGG